MLSITNSKLTNILLVVVVGLLIGIQATAIPVGEMRDQTAEHQQMIDRYMPEGYIIAKEINPNLLSHLNIYLVILYAPNHDSPKNMFISPLRLHGYQGKDDIATILAIFHGVDKSELHGADKQLLDSTINETNRIESLVKYDRYYRLLFSKMSPAEIRPVKFELEALERVVDWTVTKLQRRKELGITGPELFDAARRLIAYGAPIWQVELSMRLEAKIRGIQFSPNQLANLFTCPTILTAPASFAPLLRTQPKAYRKTS